MCPSKTPPGTNGYGRLLQRPKALQSCEGPRLMSSKPKRSMSARFTSIYMHYVTVSTFLTLKDIELFLQRMPGSCAHCQQGERLPLQVFCCGLASSFPPMTLRSRGCQQGERLPLQVFCCGLASSFPPMTLRSQACGEWGGGGSRMTPVETHSCMQLFQRTHALCHCFHLPDPQGHRTFPPKDARVMCPLSTRREASTAGILLWSSLELPSHDSQKSSVPPSTRPYLA